MEKEIFLPTTDDWHGNFKGNRMCLSLVDREGEWCIHASGTDDFALEREFSSYEIALNFFRGLSKRQTMTQQHLLDIGFQHSC